jgi:hypothetical protein
MVESTYKVKVLRDLTETFLASSYSLPPIGTILNISIDGQTGRHGPTLARPARPGYESCRA